MKHISNLAYTITLGCALFSCSQTENKQTEEVADTNKKFKIITLDPGHFHAALVQKTMFDNVDSTVYVFASEGPDVQDHLKRIEGYNSRPDNPTRWQEKVYTGNDFMQKMVEQKPGNVVVISGNNLKKAEYIKQSVDAGLHVLADKPMCIDSTGFELLKEAFQSAEKNNVLLYDIMTERSEISTMLQKELSQNPEIFGELQKGSLKDPAVTKESVHHFFKYVSGSPLKRPAWFMDVAQQGEGVVDVTTHLVDLVQWECFPEQTIDYQKDIELLNARRWTTPMTRSQFALITQMPDFPEYLRANVKDSTLHIYSNGEINYKLKDVHAKVSVIWNYQAPEGAGDTHYSIMKGSKANLVIRQGAEEKYIPELYIEPVKGMNVKTYETALTQAFEKVKTAYPGVQLKKQTNKWQVVIPEKYRTGHEAHFGEVMDRFLQYLEKGDLPAWEVPNMLAKYYTTTQALRMAKQQSTNLSAR